MIATVTLNPSLDYGLYPEQFTLGKTNRSPQITMVPGGKGINNALVLHSLGVETKALGFAAGFTGKEFIRMVINLGIAADFRELSEGMTRINVKLPAYDGTEINAPGPVVHEEDLVSLIDILTDLNPGDGVIFSGSLPLGLPINTYALLLQALAAKQLVTVVDTSGEALAKAIPERPFLIKPNLQEIAELTGQTGHSREDLIREAKLLQERGARNVLISMGGDGALLVAEDGQCLYCPAPKGEVINSVGAGDSMVAGFLADYLASESYESALVNAVAAGSASAFSQGFPSREQVNELKKQLQAVRIF